jgi:MFS family permease
MQSDSQLERPPTTPTGSAARPGAVLAVLSVAAFMASLDLFIVNVALPDLGRDLGESSLGNLSWVLNGYAIVYAALLVPFGRLADRYGRKGGFLIGLAVFTLASAGCAVSGSLELLVAFRVLQAAGAALLTPRPRRPGGRAPCASGRRPERWPPRRDPRWGVCSSTRRGAGSS